MDTHPPINKSDDNLGISFTNDKQAIPTPKGLLGSNATKIKENQSHLSDHGQVFDVGRAFKSNHVDTGTIVSDRKRNRASLAQNMQSAFSEWWGKTTQAVSNMQGQSEKDVPQPRVVTKAETRSTVVQQAVSQATLAPRDDHHVVVEKFRTYKQDVARITGTPIIVKKLDERKPEWTHTVEEAVPEKAVEKPPVQKITPSRPLNPDLRPSMVAPVVDEKTRKETRAFISEAPAKKTVSYMPEHLDETPEPAPRKSEVLIAPDIKREVHAIHDTMTPPPPPKVDIPPPPVYVPEPVKREEIIVPVEASIPKEPLIPEPAPMVIRQFHSTTPPASAVEQAPEIVPPSKPEPARSQTQNPIEHQNAFKTFMMKWAIVVLIVLLGIALAVIASFYFNVWKDTPEPIQETVSVPTFFETSEQVPVTFDAGKQAFLESLVSRIGANSSELTQFYATIPEGTGVRPVTSDEFLALISANIPGKTVRALEDTIMIGSVRTNRNEPFIVIRSYNFDVLFAGLLEWEGSMQKDLAPLFGTPEGTARFTDAVRDNKSIRILYNDAGAETLLYSFIDKNTVVITASGEALAQLITKF